jgi:ferric-dicitrate binding protein FerR (iron transport regulator)
MKEKLIEKWLDDTLTEAELKSLETSSDFVAFQKMDAIAKQYKAPSFDTSKSVEAILTQKKQSSKRSSFFSYAGSIAAVFVVVFGLVYFLKPNNQNSYYASNGAKETLSLPDTSKVTLNSGSQISFNTDTWEDNRAVQLEGEAYFKVEKGNIFKVKSSQGLVTVLGTQFIIKDRTNYFEVSCYEGLVSVQVANTEYKLPAGNTLKVVDGFISKSAISEQQPPWLSQISIFKSTKLRYVLQELERQYNVSVDTQNIDTSIIFTGSFTHKNIAVALQSITKPLSLKFEVRDTIITLKK